jgi:WS/DGAT/MGAT family acyltransferase
VGGNRLTSLDGSFLRVESPAAHMHIGWKGFFAPRRDGRPVTLGLLRASIAGRLRHAPRFRQRLAFPPGGIAEPVWVDDERFDIDHHVLGLAEAGETLARARFDELCDRALSQRLPRDRALWRVLLAPRLEDGTIGVVMQVHHAMVDGKSAVEMALLLLDISPDAPPPPPDDWEAAPGPSPTRLALDALADRGGESLRLAGGLARMAVNPARGVRLADSLRRAALAAGEDVLRPAPASFVNVPIGPRRTLVHHAAALAPLLEVKRRFGATLNDVALTVVAGALRRQILDAGGRPAPLRAMVPVSVRDGAQDGGLGNRVSCVFVDLPVDRAHAVDRLLVIRAASTEFKRDQTAAAHERLIDAMALLPGLLKGPAARLAVSSKVFNLTVSNVPGPRVPVYLLGAEMREAVPVVPLAEGHALSVGMFSYAGKLVFGCYGDPIALPAVAGLPSALAASSAEIARLAPRPAPRGSVRRRRRRRAATIPAQGYMPPP